MDLSGFKKKEKRKKSTKRRERGNGPRGSFRQKIWPKKKGKKKKLMPFIVRGTAVIKTRRSFRAMNRRNKRVANV